MDRAGIVFEERADEPQGEIALRRGAGLLLVEHRDLAHQKIEEPGGLEPRNAIPEAGEKPDRAVRAWPPPAAGSHEPRPA